MSINLLDLIKGELGSSAISQTATQLGESESSVSKAISAFLPAIVGGIAGSSEKSSILEILKQAVSAGVLPNLLNGFGGDLGSSTISNLVSLIYGNKTDSIIGSVSNFAGISEGSSKSILNLTTGATAGILGKYALDNHLDESSFSNLMNGQKSNLSSLLPAGFSLASLGLGNLFGGDNEEAANLTSEAPKYEETIATASAPKVEVNRSGTTHEIASADSGGSIWKWLLPLLLLLLLGWFLWKQCDKKPETALIATTDTMTVVKDSTNTNDDTIAMKRETVMVTLPSGKTLQAYKGGIEDQIVTFLKSDEYKNATADQLKDKWFNFDNLNFEFGTTKLTPESQVQLDNLKAILTEFPDSKIKIGAYTDKKGDANVNLKLSQDRANVVKTALNSAQVKEADGYGSKFATVPAEASDKEREIDRKTAVRFMK